MVIELSVAWAVITVGFLVFWSQLHADARSSEGVNEVLYLQALDDESLRADELLEAARPQVR
jgi:hypothetical protein